MNRKWPKEMQTKAEVMAACGCSLTDIGRITGVNYKTVKRNLVAEALKQNRARALEWTKSNQERAIWRGILRRCYSPNSGAYEQYGAKGVTVCDRWKASFDAFFQDVGPKPTRNHHLNRIDCAGNYEPDNTRWGTSKEQGRNMHNNVWVSLAGQRMILSDAARQLGEKTSQVSYHVHKGTHPLIKLATHD